MASSNQAIYQTSSVFNLTPMIAVKDIFTILTQSFAEAKAMEYTTRKTSGNW
ncbi:hypothetical protein [Polynucleobacter brandtiae]|uniref:Uncharacterized protein n=1 Tax=Polynucleobacter brandtiae TaxID=1938816 RepID=A0A2M8VYF3_9BURK|nr:hypothetical protein [Polynucleobacter brandtiae]PJI82897.1 hypothetical protein B0G85_0286 [Polynucleobacter brandtiae]